MKTLSEEELNDFIYGAAVYGTGGGGSIENALKLLKEAGERKATFKLEDPSKIPDDEIVACPYGVGGGVQEEIRRRFEALPRLPQSEVVSMAIEAFEKHLGKRIFGFVPGELGSSNSLLAMYMAALTGKCAVDGDAVGRSVPEVVHSTFTLCDVSITPFVIVTPFGDVMTVMRVLNDQRAEDIDRFMAVASGGGVTVIDHPVEGRRLRKSIILNTITKSVEVGRSLRLANKKGADPVEALVKSTGGYLLFTGEISDLEREGRDGFMWGTLKLNGAGEHRGKSYKIWFKNENLMTWLDEKPHVTSPDLVSVVDAKTGRALSNWGEDLARGRRVAVIGIRAPEMWRSKRGLELLGPGYFGFKVDYRPIEKIV
jgi:hypothetical protein